MNELTAVRLREVFSYDPETGHFIWNVPPKNKRGGIGSVAGCVSGEGYRKIGIDGRVYGAHRLAWMYMTGELPNGHHVDHINMDKDDNRWCNLRAATHGQNKANSPGRSASGFKGVYVVKKRGRVKYRAQLRSAGRIHHLGYYSTPLEANVAYAEAADRMHGEFARGN